MKNILITGANGLLGREVCSAIDKKNYTVFATTHSNNFSPVRDVNYIELDFSDHWSDSLLPRNVDVVIHLAQSPNFRCFPEKALDVFNVNINSTAKLLDYAKRAGGAKFIYASSGGVYGNGDKAFTENAPIVPVGELGYYLGSKACGEILVQSYATEFQVGILRPFFMFGPSQNRSMLIPRLFDLVASDKPVVLQGENGIRINPIHIKDAAAAVISMLNYHDSATFNIAGPDVLSIRSICEGIGHFLDKTPIFEMQSGYVHDLIADTSAMEDLLVKPKIRLLDVLGDISI